MYETEEPVGTVMLQYDKNVQLSQMLYVYMHVVLSVHTIDWYNIMIMSIIGKVFLVTVT